MWSKRLGLPLLTAVFLMLSAAGIAYADLKAVHWIDGWDEGSNPEQYAHGLNDVTFDGRWVPFLHELDFDNDLYVPTNPAHPQHACPASPELTTKWAGVMEFGLYHLPVDSYPDLCCNSILTSNTQAFSGYRRTSNPLRHARTARQNRRARSEGNPDCLRATVSRACPLSSTTPRLDSARLDSLLTSPAWPFDIEVLA